MPFLERQGVRLHYRDTGDGRPPIILLPGFGGRVWHWNAQARAFSRSHRVVRMDFRGHGSSDAPRGEYTIEVFANDVAWSIHRLALKRPIVVGHSMGGTVALQLAVDRPSVVKGVVLVDSIISEETRRELRGRPHGEWTDLFDPQFDRSIAQRVAREVRDVPAHVSEQAIRSVFSHPSAEALQKLRVPLLFVAGDRGGRDPEQARRTLSGTSAWFGQAVGSGHYVMMEVPDQFNAMLRRFIDALERRPSAFGQLK